MLGMTSPTASCTPRAPCSAYGVVLALADRNRPFDITGFALAVTPAAVEIIHIVSDDQQQGLL